MTPAAKLRLLGPPEAYADGSWTRLVGQRRAGLLAYLALEGPTERERLAALLWDTERAQSNLRVELHRLEKRFPGLLRREGARLILAETSDVELFLRALEGPAEEDVLELYRGPLLEGVRVQGAAGFEEWLLMARERLEQRYLDALVERADRLAGGDPARAVELHRRVLERDPMREASCRAVMRLYAQMGETRRALEFYEQYARFLERELGLPPVQTTRRLAEELRTGRVRVRRWRRPVLAGREEALARMEAAWNAGRHVVLAGEPGIGKTRLLHEFARLLEREPLLLRGRPEDHAVPLATATRGLRVALERHAELPDWAQRELARLLPELGEPPRDPTPQRFLAAIAELLRPLDSDAWFWGVDDLQFFDPASLELLTQLHALGLRRPLAVTYRTGTLGSLGQAWVQSLVERQGAEVIELEPLEPDAVAQMLADGGRFHPEWVRALHRFTGGNPFFIVQLAETWQAEERPGGEAFCPRISDRLHALLRQRAAAVPPRARSLLRLAAVAGEVYTPALAAAVMGVGPLEVAEAADALEYQGLFRRGRLAHDLVREAVLRDLDPATVRALHAQVAEQIEGDAAPGLVASHYERAGLPERALPWRLAAAEGAIRGFAYREAFEQFHRAFELAPPDERNRLVAETLITRYRIGVAVGDWALLERELDLTEEAARALGDAYTLNNVRVGRVDLSFRRLDLERAVRLGRELLEREDLTADQEAMATYALAQALFYLEPGRYEEVARLCERATSRVDEGWYMWGWPFATLALCRIKGGELSEAERLARQAEAHFTAQGDLAGQAMARRTLGLVDWWRGDVEAAAAAFDRAVELATRAEYRTILYLVLDTTYGFYRVLGDGERAAALRRELERRGFDPEAGDLQRLGLAPPQPDEG